MNEHTANHSSENSLFDETNIHEHVGSFRTPETDQGYSNSLYWIRIRVQLFEEDCVSLELTEEDKQKLDKVLETTPELNRLFSEIAERDNREQFSQMHE